MLRYPVLLKPDTNGTILVSFIDVHEAHTFGEDREDALTHALEALEFAFIGYMEDRQPIPIPSAVKRGPYTALPALSESKLALYSAMRTGRITKTELAKRLNCHLPQIDRLLDLRHGSRLDLLEAAFRVLGKQLTIEIRDAA